VRPELPQAPVRSDALALYDASNEINRNSDDVEQIRSTGYQPSDEQ
jgi:hypothetical protein